MSYELILQENLKEINSVGSVYSHACGAKIIHIENSDTNKVFSITFNTPVKDNSGVSHVLEHCVLCGSEKYPIKDPFNELSKGSVYTYLNAMTFTDRTMYPIASCNHQDFHNLMDVYLDAVFFPLISKRPEVFAQEGWNYQLNASKASVKNHGGIVFNEMLGVYCDPMSVVKYHAYSGLFGSSPYAYDAGGVPKDIITLGYEEFLAYYREFYRADNCYIYLYGDLDFKEVSQYIHSEYLSKFPLGKPRGAKNHDTFLLQKPLYVTKSYGGFEGMGEGVKNHLGIFYKGNPEMSPPKTLALRLLNLYLMEMKSSPLRKNFLVENLGREAVGYFSDSLPTPVFGFAIKDAGKSIHDFQNCLYESLWKISKDGFDEDLLRACIDIYTFSLREEYFKNRPKGLNYAITLSPNKIDGKDPFGALSPLKHLESLENNRDYFKTLLKEMMLDNPNQTLTTLNHEKTENCGLFPSASYPKITKKILKDALSLEAYQNTEDSSASLGKIPVLKPSDIDHNVEATPIFQGETSQVKTLFLPLETRGVVYTDFIFDSTNVPQENLGYIRLVCYLTSKLKTRHYSLEGLTSSLNSALGGYELFPAVFRDDRAGYSPKVVLRTKTTTEKSHLAFEFALELLLNTLFEEENTIKLLVSELLSKLTHGIINNGHSFAIGRTKAHLHDSSAYMQHLKGLEFYLFLQDLVKNFDRQRAFVLQTLKNTAKLMFTGDDLIVCITADDPGQTGTKEVINGFVSAFPRGHELGQSYSFPKAPKLQGFVIPSQVQYVAKAFDYKTFGLAYSGKLSVLLSLLEGEYLTEQVRIKGGAYGCYGGCNRSGALFFYSFRDNNIKNTIDAFDRAGGFLETLDISPELLNKHIMGAINKQLRPVHVSDCAATAISNHLSNVTFSALATEREETLTTTARDLKNMSKIVHEGMDGGCLAVVGNSAAIGEAQLALDKVVELGCKA